MSFKITSILPIIGKVIDRLFPDKNERDKARLTLIALEQEGKLKELEVAMSAILMEAQSKDPWTSRARPSFMYVMYVMILAAVPMGFVHAFDPSLAKSIGAGVSEWLKAIPEPMWTLFGAGYLGYGWFRTKDKTAILNAKSID